jgi:hypothetical protein
MKKVHILRGVMMLMSVGINILLMKDDLGRKGQAVVVIVLLILQITKDFTRENIKRAQGKAKSVILVTLII